MQVKEFRGRDETRPSLLSTTSWLLHKSDSVHFAPLRAPPHILANNRRGSLGVLQGLTGQQRAARRSEAHLAAVPAQDGVVNELLGVNLQLVLQRTLHAHLLSPLLT